MFKPSVMHVTGVEALLKSNAENIIGFTVQSPYSVQNFNKLYPNKHVIISKMVLFFYCSGSFTSESVAYAVNVIGRTVQPPNWTEEPFRYTCGDDVPTGRVHSLW